MTNKEIAGKFALLADLMELYQENSFKIKSYQNAYRTIRGLDQEIIELPLIEIQKIPGIGQAISEKIEEIKSKGSFSLLNQYLEKTPPGILNMLEIKGLGPKKIKTIWEELEVDSIGGLMYAINENRLIELKGFGKKTQEDIKNKLLFFEANKSLFRLSVAKEALELFTFSFMESGESIQNLNSVSALTLLTDTEPSLPTDLVWNKNHNVYETKLLNGLPINIYISPPERLGNSFFELSSPPNFINAFEEKFPGILKENFSSEPEIFERANIPFLPPEIRWDSSLIGLAPPTLIEKKDILGLVHLHTTYSDGSTNLETMANYAIKNGFEYMVVTDHSKSAFYANGLSEERVLMQGREIDELNKKLYPFKIFKGIESDILSSGYLDYEDSFLSYFDVVIASVHSNLKMDQNKAMDRLLTAISQKHTHILGHPTGRLLLSREGYPIDHQVIIDACAENNVAIELNANPYRLDLDWSWIPYAIEKNVLISINPDAHQLAGIHDIQYGIYSARRGKLTSEGNLTSKNLHNFQKWVDFQKQKQG